MTENTKLYGQQQKQQTVDLMVINQQDKKNHSLVPHGLISIPVIKTLEQLKLCRYERFNVPLTHSCDVSGSEI